ncbi:MAG: caspase family protein, partial [Leptolyngbya sp. SIO1D8]|nr:caspase family protein [Leptolyngbya sp. SIO1D8]
MSMNLYALLVGINEYRAVSKLRGCVNDVEAVEQFLLEKCHVPEAHIRTLKDEEATRQNILDTFQHFLIQNPQIQRADQILFWYSGHGSRSRDTQGIEPDGYLETLVPQDSRTEGIYDISDKEIAILLEDLAAAKGENITVVLDSCHSGSGTRDITIEGETVALAREVPADDRIPPVDLDSAFLKRSVGSGSQPSGWSSPTTPYVLLAGCRSHEQSNEYLVQTGDTDGVWHGALTHFILKALKTLAPDSLYSELHEQVAAQVNGIYSTQMPQCEGDRDRQVFGGARVERDPFIVVQAFDGHTVTLGAGLTLDLHPGTKLALYAPTVRTRSQLPDPPLAIVEVTSAQATSAKAKVNPADQETFMTHVEQWAQESLGKSERISQFTSQPIRGVIARGLVTERAYSSIPQTVSLQAEAGEENQTAIERLQYALQSQHFQVLDDSAQDAKLHVVAADGQYFIRDFRNDLLVEPIDRGENDVNRVRYALENIARFQTLLQLKNEESGSALAGNIEVHLRSVAAKSNEYVSDGTKTPTKPEWDGGSAGALTPFPDSLVGAGGEISLCYDPENLDRNLYVVEVENTSSRNIYPHVFVMSADYSIVRLYPEAGLEKALAPHKRLIVEPTNGGSRLEIYLPDGKEGEVRWDSSRDYIIVVAATAPADLSGLEQAGLSVPPPERNPKRAGKSPLDALVETLLYESGTRLGRRQRTFPQEDWATVLLPYTTVRKHSTVTLDVAADRIDLGDGLTLIKPQGFQGEVAIATLDQGLRGIEGDPTLALPPGLAAHTQQFQPLERVGTRSVGPSQLVITFDLDEASRQRITPDNPLGLEIQGLTGEQGAEWLPVVFDGEDYLLAGYRLPGSDRVALVNLPPVVTPAATGHPTKRGLLRTLRLFLYKKMGRYTPLTGLHRAELINGEVVYHEVARKQFQAGQRVALFV